MGDFSDSRSFPTKIAQQVLDGDALLQERACFIAMPGALAAPVKWRRACGAAAGVHGAVCGGGVRVAAWAGGGVRRWRARGGVGGRRCAAVACAWRRACGAAGVRGAASVRGLRAGVRAVACVGGVCVAVVCALR
ncbi:hypothetical protein ACQP00_10260 [Dactylosporangium sp. CS-047395]|uniref:hypothetical protein n=1 Tax=Dactylosporangium sp. CS-047395 TaxID=3239936 RepID=UPI003D8D1E62